MICLGLLMINYFFMLYISIKQADLQLAYFKACKTNNKKTNTPKYPHLFPQPEQKQSLPQVWTVSVLGGAKEVDQFIKTDVRVT